MKIEPVKVEKQWVLLTVCCTSKILKNTEPVKAKKCISLHSIDIPGAVKYQVGLRLFNPKSA
jgi:hypothetical protein